VTGRRGQRRKQILDYVKEKRGYWKLKEKALDRSLWRNGFGRGCGPVVKMPCGMYTKYQECHKGKPSVQLTATDRDALLRI
jgi:hypothetical protein